MNPIVKGGQGHSAEELEWSAKVVVVCALGMLVTLALAVLGHLLR